MKFDVILNHNSTRKFDKILFNGQNCILGTQRGLETDEHISVLVCLISQRYHITQKAVRHEKTGGFFAWIAGREAKK